MNDTQQFLVDIYLEWVNDYLTSEVMAKDKGIPQELLAKMINAGAVLHENNLTPKELSL